MMFGIVMCTIIGAALACPISFKTPDCCARMAEAGIELKNFNMSVAHGIHSLSIEHIKHYFNAVVPQNNGIPTVNTDFTGEDVIPSVPSINKDPEILSLNMQVLDFIFRNNDDKNRFWVRGLSHVEKLAHAAHMDELWTRTKSVYEEIRRNPPTDNLVCSCITDEENNGIIESLKVISNTLRNFGVLDEIDKPSTDLPNAMLRRKRSPQRIRPT